MQYEYHTLHDYYTLYDQRQLVPGERFIRKRQAKIRLGPQLAHLCITGTANFRAVRETERRAKFHEMAHGVRYIILLFQGEAVPPISKFVGELDFPRHTCSMPYTECSQIGRASC